MTNTKKAFKDLSQAGKDARIKKYRDLDAKYGLKEGLFLVTKIVRHADKTFNAGTAKESHVASFGYNVKPIKVEDASDFPVVNGTNFTWVNQLINLESGAKVVDAMEKLADKVNAPVDENGKTLVGADGKNVKGHAVLASIKYKMKGKFVNVNQVFERPSKKRAASSQTSAEA